MKLIHISDTHGGFPFLKNQADLIIHSGDMLPNRTRGILAIEPGFQEAWLRGNKDKFLNWLGGEVPFFFVQGNHDFINPCPFMQEMGIDARNITGKVETFCGLKFFGFCEVPWFGGEWANEYGEETIAHRFAPVVDMINNGEIDILVTHGPIQGWLDRNVAGEWCGSSALRKAFIYDMKRYPKWMLHGHIHESHGMKLWNCNGMTMNISNAATTQHLIEVQ